MCTCVLFVWASLSASFLVTLALLIITTPADCRSCTSRTGSPRTRYLRLALQHRSHPHTVFVLRTCARHLQGEQERTSSTKPSYHCPAAAIELGMTSQGSGSSHGNALHDSLPALSTSWLEPQAAIDGTQQLPVVTEAITRTYLSTQRDYHLVCTQPPPLSILAPDSYRGFPYLLRTSITPP